MSRAALRAAIAIFACVVSSTAWALDPHMDPGLLPSGCPACHRGHGVASSPMLPGRQVDVCLACHGTQAGRDRAVLEGALASHARPPLLETVRSQPFAHPMDDTAHSRLEPGAITCTSCHAPHRSTARGARSAAAGGPKRSTLDPNRFEYELCASCHGGKGTRARSLRDIGRLSSSNNRSFHPVEAPSADGAPSIVSTLAGSRINCTDCHGNSDPRGARGPHGSALPFILRDGYATVDGQPESAAAYALCYRCHDRERVLDSPRFPGHRVHVVDRKVACGTCHDPHGSTENRALIRFGDEYTVPTVAPSTATDRIEFISHGPGSGACYVSCHGQDHAPATYGGALPDPGAANSFAVAARVETGSEPRGTVMRRGAGRTSLLRR